MAAPDEPADDVAASLRAIRDELATRAAALISGAEMPTGGISFGKRVGEGTNVAIERFTDVAIHDQIRQQLRSVDHALELLDAGRYGVCETCAEPIPGARLEAVPWATTCVGCAG